MRVRPAVWLPVLVVLHLALALGYGAVLPLFNWPDEPAHLNRVRAVAAGELQPAMQPGGWAPAELEALKRRHFAGATSEDPAIRRLTYENHQPPLYYLAAAAVWSVTARPEVVKLLNLALSCLVVCLPVALARVARWADPWRAPLATVVLALSPMRCFMAVSIGNDVLAELIFGVYTAAVVMRCRPVVIGLVIGAGALTKTSMLVALPLYLLWLGLEREGASTRGILRRVLVASVAAGVVLSPWIVHNVVTYGPGDPLALAAGAFGSDAETAAELGAERPRLALVGEHGVVSFASRLFASWWGTFGWMEMAPDPRAMGLYVLLSSMVLVGLATAWRRRDAAVAQPLVGWCVGAVAAAVVAVGVYSLADLQPQGRYVLLVSLPSSVLFAVGLRAFAGRWVAPAAAGAGLALLGVNLLNLVWVIPWYLR